MKVLEIKSTNADQHRCLDLCRFVPFMRPQAALGSGTTFGGNLTPNRFLAVCCWILALIAQMQAAPLMEEGFNYPSGTGLAANSPWAGSSGSSAAVVSGNLTYTNLRSTVPFGNMVQITGGTSRTVYRNFSSNAVTGGTVYCSALIRCLQPPTNSQFIASLMAAGSTSHNRDTDPIALSVNPSANGFTYSLTSVGGDSTSGGGTMATNTTHLIVLKYAFVSRGVATLYVDPLPGGAEPASPAITADTGDNIAANLQVLLLQSAASTAQGTFNLDAIRVGTNWADVTPLVIPLSVTGPQNQAVCFGSSVSFSVQAAGTPPYSYLWRTNGIGMAKATNSVFTLNNPSGLDALKNYDVVVNDAFGSITSRVANLTFSTNAADIVIQPNSQLVSPGASSATFTATIAGDPPLNLQWRTNGIAIPGATNASYTIANPGLADAANAIDLVAANPCGTVTSAPPVSVIFPNQFLAGYDAGAGFFSGEDLMLTNASGANICVWSSPSLLVPVNNWTLEGPMSEQVYNNNSGLSLYSINVNPTTSPVYYIFAHTNTGPYTAIQPMVILSTSDYLNFAVTGSSVPISSNGLMDQITFYGAYDAGPGFFSGEDLILTNASGANMSVWSSPDPSVSVTNWTLEGTMSEQVFNNNSGLSLYSINVNPGASPVYYIFAQTNVGIYTSTEPVVWLTTADYINFTVTGSSVPISTNGIFMFAAPPGIVQPPKSLVALAGQNITFSATATGSGLGYQWFFNNVGLSAVSVPALSLINLSATNTGNYFIVVTNSVGTVTSSVATLTVVNPPVLKIGSIPPSTVQLTANTITNLTYVVQSATNLVNPFWVSILTNNTGLNGLISFQTNTMAALSQFYRLYFPSPFPLPPQITQQPQSMTVLAGQSRALTVSANDPGAGYQWFFNNSSASVATTPLLNLTNISLANAGTYTVVVTNALGAATSTVVTLNVAVPPVLKLAASIPGSIQLSANSVTGLTYLVQMATNLMKPIWQSVVTNNTGINGAVNFQTNTTATKSQYFRLVFP